MMRLTAQVNKEARKDTRAYGGLGLPSSQLRDPEDVIAGVLKFANGEVRPASVYRYPPKIGDGVFALQTSENDWEEVDLATVESIAQHRIDRERAFAERLLNAATQGTAQLIRQIRVAIRARVHTSMTLHPVVALRGRGGFEMSWRISGGDDARGWALFAAGLIAHNAAGRAETNIGKCRLETCGRFFEIKRGELGNVRRLYCCPEHRLEQHARVLRDLIGEIRVELRGDRLIAKLGLQMQPQASQIGVVAGARFGIFRRRVRLAQAPASRPPTA